MLHSPQCIMGYAQPRDWLAWLGFISLLAHRLRHCRFLLNSFQVILPWDATWQKRGPRAACSSFEPSARLTEKNINYSLLLHKSIKYCHVEWILTGFGLVIGFTGLLNTTWLHFTNHYHTKVSVLSHGLHCVAWQWLPTVAVPLLPGSHPRRLAAISHQPPTLLTAVSGLSRNGSWSSL
jgi:hypothetical protein